MQTEFEATKYDETLRTKTAESKEMESQRDDYLKELANLNKQADTRAKLALTRSEKEQKEKAMQSGFVLDFLSPSIADLLRLDRHAANHRKYIGTEPVADRMETDINQATK